MGWGSEIRYPEKNITDPGKHSIKSEGTQMSEGRDTDKRFIIVHSFSFLFCFKLFQAKQSYIPYLKCRNIP
jgi:hypothetical protein